MSDGYHLFLASGTSQWQWKPLTTITPAGDTSDPWLGAHCLTGTGRYAVVELLSRHASDDPIALDRGGLAYVVDVATGHTTPLLGGVAVRYYTPGCGADDRVVLTRYLGAEQAETQLILCDVATDAIASEVTVDGEITSAVPSGGRIAGVRGNQVLSIDPSTGVAAPLATTEGRPYDLRASADGAVSFLSDTTTGSQLWSVAAGKAPVLIGEGPAVASGLFAGRTGRTFVVGVAASGGTTQVAVPSGHMVRAVSLDGGVELVTARSSRTTTPPAKTKLAESTVIAEDSTLLDTHTGAILTHDLPTGSSPSSTTALPRRAPTPTSPGTVAAPVVTSNMSPNTTTPACAVARIDPTIQVPQPGPATIDWGIQESVRNALTGSNGRPAGVWNLGLPAYSPNSDFPAVALSGAASGTPVPPQVLEGILAQESNWKQASWHAEAGISGDPLIANYYGTNSSATTIDYNQADCGYGIGQVTDFMTAASTAQPQSIKVKVAVDYAENIAAAAQILAGKWNQLSSLGITVNDANPNVLEDWYDAIWAYNSGIHPDDGSGHSGLGWANNPINPAYPPNRTEFLSTTYADAATPWLWPYQERVMGWMDTPLLQPNGQPSYTPATVTGDHLTIPPISTFCTVQENSCNPNDPSKMYCLLSNLHCWWHTTASFADCSKTGLGFCHDGFFTVSQSSSEPVTADPNPPACSGANLPAGTVVVDDERTNLNVVGCPNPPSDWHQGGTVTTTFGSDSSGAPIGQIDWHQLGAGFGGHMWFTHTVATSDVSLHDSMVWQPTTLPNQGGTYTISAFVPDVGATDPTATYHVEATSDSPIQSVSINQSQYFDQWVSLGSFTLYSGATVELDNIQGSNPDGADLGFDAIAFIPTSGSAAPAGTPLTPPEGYGNGSPSELMFCLCQGSAGDPVDTASGNYHENFTDISIPGRGPALSFARTYNSLAAASAGPFGFGWSFSYGMSASVNGSTGAVTITEEGGSQIVFTPSGGGYTGPPRMAATLVHNGDGTYTFTRRARQIFTFSSAGQLISTRDLNGYTTSLTYGSPTEVTLITDPVGRTVSVGWTGSHITAVTDVAGRQVTYQYNDGQGNLTDVFDVNGGHYHFTYDGSHRLLTVTDPRGSTASTAYDSQARVSSQTDALQRTTTFTYSGSNFTQSGGTTTITDPKGNVTVEYYGNGMRLAVTKAYGTPSAATTQYSYDPNSIGITKIIDPNGGVTTMSYDASGNMVSRTDPMQRVTTWTYDSLNDQVTETDGSGETATRQYDSAGNLLSVAAPLKQNGTVVATRTTTYQYTDSAHHGDITAMVDPDGKTTAYTYDSYGNRISTTDAAGDMTTSTFNNLGWVLSKVAARGNVAGCGCAASYTTTYSYVDGTGHTDEYGDVQTVTDPLGHQTTKSYDADRNVISARDPAGGVTTYTYDAANQQTDVHRPDGSDLVSTYWPDSSLSSRKVVDSGGGIHNLTAYAYDPTGRLATVTPPVSQGNPTGTATSYGYDTRGNLVATTDAMGRTTTRSYDADSELTAVSYSDGHTPSVSSITYDNDGRRLSEVDGTGTEQWAYDTLGRLTSSTDGSGKAVAYAYDLKGLLTAVTYPAPGGTVQRTYDAAGRLVAVQDWLGNRTAFTVDPDGNVVSQQDPNGVKTTTTMDAADQASAITDTAANGSGPVLASLGYTRNQRSQVTAETTQGLAGGGLTTTYDNVGRLTQFNGGSYAYDAADDTTSLPAGTTQLFDDGNELTATASPITIVGAPVSAGSSATATSLTLNLPAGIQANDQIVVVSAQNGVTAPSASGYTVVGTSAVNTAPNPETTTVLRKTAAGGESQVTLTYTSPGARAALVTVYRGVNPSSPVDSAGSVTGSATASTSVTVPSLPLQAAGERLVLAEGGAGNAASAAWTAPAGMSEQIQRTDIATVTAGLADQVLGAPGATGTRTATVSVAANLGAVAFGLVPAATTTFGDDANGDRVSATQPTGASLQYTYDQAGRLTAYGSAATYSYNGDGLRVGKVTPVGTSHFVWDLSGSVPLLLSDGASAWVYGVGSHPIEQVNLAGITAVQSAVAGNATGSAQSLTVTLPSPVAPNDEILLGVSENGTQAVTPPAGFTLAGQAIGTGTTATETLLYRKTAVGSESALTLTLGGPAAVSAVAAVYRGVDVSNPTTPLDGPTSAWQFLSSAVTAGSVSAATTGQRLVLLAGSGGNAAPAGWTMPGMQVVAQKSDVPVTSIGLADQALSSAGASGSRTADFGTTANLGAVMVCLRAQPVLYLHQDQLGSTRMVTDPSGTVRSTMSFDPSGNLEGWSGVITTPLRFAGEYTDAESGLIYLRARYYDPATAQFLTRDPLSSMKQAPYAYVSNDPLDATDPTGLLDCGWFSWACDAGNWALHNGGTIVTVVAAGVCVASTMGVCAGAVAVAFGARAAQRWFFEGGSSTLGADALDALTTAASFGLVGVPGSIGMGEDVPEWLTSALGIGAKDLTETEEAYNAWTKWLAKGLLASPDAVDLAIEFLRGGTECQ